MPNNELQRASRQMPSAPPMPDSVLPMTRESRAIARNDRQTVMQARRDYNEARLDLHRLHLDGVKEAAEIDQNAHLTTYAMQKAVEVDDVARCLSAGRSPNIEMTLREMQAANNAGEVARIIKRGYKL